MSLMKNKMKKKIAPKNTLQFQRWNEKQWDTMTAKISIDKSLTKDSTYYVKHDLR